MKISKKFLISAVDSIMEYHIAHVRQLISLKREIEKGLPIDDRHILSGEYYGIYYKHMGIIIEAYNRQLRRKRCAQNKKNQKKYS